LNQRTTVRVLKQSFRDVLPSFDGRCKLSPLDFVTGLVFCFLSDTKSSGLEAIRRYLIGQFEVSISKGAFWERLSGKRLNEQLHDVLAQLMKRLSKDVLVGKKLLSSLDVNGIYLLDSSSVSLWDGASAAYPGAWTTAAVKWHACIDVLSGQSRWFEISPGSRNDRKCFPPLELLAGKLVIFDLGYWDYRLLLMIDTAKGYFLSRVKTNAVIRIEEVVTGLPASWVGKALSEFKPKRKRKMLIEAKGLISHGQESTVFRLVGFWNATDKKYHWYITNLAVSASLLYPLYRIRWTLELIFKSHKRSFNLDKRLTSNNELIIESLVLSTIIAGFACSAVLELGAKSLTAPQRLAMSFQRSAQIVVQLATEFIDYITQSAKEFTSRLLNKIHLFSNELFEKNHQHRPTALARVHAML